MSLDSDRIKKLLDTTGMRSSPLFNKQTEEPLIGGTNWHLTMPWWNLLVNYDIYQTITTRLAMASKWTRISRGCLPIPVMVFAVLGMTSNSLWIYPAGILAVAFISLEFFRAYLADEMNLLDRAEKLEPFGKLCELAREMNCSTEELLNCTSEEQIQARANEVLMCLVRNVLRAEKECVEARKDSSKSDVVLRILYSNADLQRENAERAHRRFTFYGIIDRSYGSYWQRAEAQMTGANGKK